MENVLINLVWAGAIVVLSLNVTKIALKFLEQSKKESDRE